MTAEDDKTTVERSGNLKVAIVVPFTDWNDWVLDCVRACHALDRPTSELWLLPNRAPDETWGNRLKDMGMNLPLRIEPTGPGNPAMKRNVAMRKSDADVFALVDSDAWPRSDWLARGLPLLDGNVTVVTGPNLTPPEDPLSRRVCGRVMESPLGFGGGYLRHVQASRRTVREMPTCNMLIRRQENLFFREALDTGEDMMLCSDVRARGFQVLYDPEVVVFHHRRRLLRPFMRQFYHYGLDKGRLTRQSRDVTYAWQAAPALLTVYLLLGVLVNLLPLPAAARLCTLLPLCLYAVAVMAEVLRLSTSWGERLICPFAFLCAHLAYGWGYLRGLLGR